MSADRTDSGLYRKPPTPEMAAMLLALEAKARAPKKPRKSKVKPKRTRDAFPPPAHDHGQAQAILAQVQQRLSIPTVTSGPPRGPDGWGSPTGMIATTMDDTPREGRRRAYRRLAPPA